MLPSGLLRWPCTLLVCLSLFFTALPVAWGAEYEFLDMWQLKSSKVQLKARPAEPVVGTAKSQDYTLRKGDTLWDISKRFKVDVKILQQANKITKPESLQIGTRIVIPLGGKSQPQDYQLATRGVASLEWPVVGVITSGFGGRGRGFHHGLDIATKAGTPIKAIEAGKVIFSDYRNSVYGNTVIIDHGGDLKTFYAHNKKNIVKKGDWVKVGQTIALIGSTGRSTGPHVHLEIHQKDQPVNPLRYLSKR